MKVTVIPVIAGDLGTITKGLEKRLLGLDNREGCDTTARIPRKVLEIRENFLSLKPQ